MRERSRAASTTSETALAFLAQISRKKMIGDMCNELQAAQMASTNLFKESSSLTDKRIDVRKNLKSFVPATNAIVQKGGKEQKCRIQVYVKQK